MKRHASFIRKNIFEGPLFDWCEFPDEALQFDTWNLNFDAEENDAAETERRNDSETDDDNRKPE